MILVTTAGKVGSEAARQLAQSGEQLRVLARGPEKATHSPAQERTSWTAISRCLRTRS
jgi:uncharacterized protein YbjT (DUF2867 family)